MSGHHKSLEVAASVLNGLLPDLNAQVSYDLFAGGLSWSDEAPPFSLENVGKSVKVLRPLIRYRSSLIEGNPDERFRSLWDEALQRMPSWPGFAPERRDAKLLPLLKDMEEKVQMEIDELESRLGTQGAGTPASLDVLTNEARGLGLNMQLEKKQL